MNIFIEIYVEEPEFDFHSCGGRIMNLRFRIPTYYVCTLTKKNKIKKLFLQERSTACCTINKLLYSMLFERQFFFHYKSWYLFSRKSGIYHYCWCFFISIISFNFELLLFEKNAKIKIKSRHKNLWKRK